MNLGAQNLTLAGRLAGVSVTLRPGEVTAICGPNGAGKSTLLSVLAGLLSPDSGRVQLDAASLAAMRGQDRARILGYLPQSPEVAWDVSVETLVSLGRIPWPDAPADEQGEAIDAAIRAMDMDALRHRPVSQLSGGERARALAARVLAGRPRWLLADEPLANLDLAHAASLVARLREQARGGVGVVLVLHDLATAMNHADRVIVLEQGRVAADGPPHEALREDTIAAVWGIRARWLGDRGEQALSVSHLADGPP